MGPPRPVPSAPGPDGPVALAPGPDKPVAEPPSAALDGEPPWPLAGQPIETTKTFITALILAFMFRAFLIEPFIVPTGSMAHSLLGVHATAACENCGWTYDCGPQRGARNEGPFQWPDAALCPNCQFRIDDPGQADLPVKEGDRILVERWPFEIGGSFGPKRWDVIVFREPADPEQNYIKRLVGLPGDSVEILDGDVFINGRIARKTPAAQRSLWLPVFYQDFEPLEEADFGVLPRWAAIDDKERLLPADVPDGWCDLGRRTIRHVAADATPHRLVFAPRGAHAYFDDVYAYNYGASHARYGDVRIAAESHIETGDGTVEFEIRRRDRSIRVRWSAAGRVELNIGARPGYHVAAPPCAIDAPAPPPRGTHTIEFVHIDWRAALAIDGREVIATDERDYAPNLDVLRNADSSAPTEVRITAARLNLSLSRLRIDRDVHYTFDADDTRRAGPGDPFELGRDEYFVLGDNSPQSHDSREWTVRGVHLPTSYRLGTVRADQIVGRAVFVYLPGLQSPQWGWWKLPDIGRARFIR